MENELKKADFKKPKEPKIKGKKIDPIKELKRAFKEPGKGVEVGGRGYV